MSDAQQPTTPTPALADHRGQRVLVTAAASGIGLATAAAFAALGARVFICDVDPLALHDVLCRHPEWAGLLCDVSDEVQVDTLFQAALSHLGGLDVLVSNAGIAGPTALVQDMAFADWQRCLAVNLDSAFLCARRAAAIMQRQRHGCIVNMSSNAGQYGFPRRAPYAAAKWAIRGLTRTLAQELGPFGVRVNCICPGSVSGQRIDRVIAAEAGKTGETEAQVRQRMVESSSLKTFVAPEDIAQTIVFLASPAGARISGQDITVDGHTETL